MNFYKMNGLGNQFNIFDMRDISELSFAEISDISETHNIKQDYDQLILIENSDNADCYMKIYNIDGSISSACGNATRCVARIIADENNLEEVNIETNDRILHVKRKGDLYEVNMGKAKTSWQDIPLTSAQDTENIELLDNRLGPAIAANMGNPHIVFFCDDIDRIDLATDISPLANHDLFPEGVNINIAMLASDNHIRLKTWERGAGATQACGTGACATFYAARVRNLVTNQAKITMPGGSLEISMNQSDEIIMLGDANLEETLNISIS